MRTRGSRGEREREREIEEGREEAREREEEEGEREREKRRGGGEGTRSSAARPWTYITRKRPTGRGEREKERGGSRKRTKRRADGVRGLKMKDKGRRRWNAQPAILPRTKESRNFVGPPGTWPAGQKTHGCTFVCRTPFPFSVVPPFFFFSPVKMHTAFTFRLDRITVASP